MIAWQSFTQDVFDANLARDGLGGRTIISGQHPDLESEGLQLLDGSA